METASPVLRSRAARPKVADRTTGTRSSLNGSIPACENRPPDRERLEDASFARSFFGFLRLSCMRLA